jgi:enterochelin esterase family protein
MSSSGVGTDEADMFKQGIRKLHSALEEAKIQHVYSESPGTAHEWQTWRRTLQDFAPRLFQGAGRKAAAAARK